MSKQIFALVLVFTVLLAQSSCMLTKKAKRKKVEIDTTTVTVTAIDTNRTEAAATAAAAALNEQKLLLIKGLTPLWKRSTDFSTFSGKAKMHYEGRGQKEEFTAHIRIRKDSVIWVSVTAIGGIVQVARIYITRDSFKMISYLEKRVTVLPLSLASKVLPAPVDFTTLQNLVIGNVLLAAGTPTDATDFGGTLTLEASAGSILQQVTYNKSDSTMRTLQMRSSGDDGPAGVIQYGNYQGVDGRSFPMSRAINLMNAGEQYYLDMNFANANFDQALDFPFSIPKNYKTK